MCKSQHSLMSHTDQFYNFSIVFLLLHQFSQQIQCQVTKCCPLDSVLRIQNGYSCELQTNHTIWDAYNILPSVMPRNCKLIRNVFDNSNTHTELNCLDKDSNNQFLALSCFQRSISTVHLMNKCCPNGHLYDHNERRCIHDSRTHFQTLFGNSAVVFENKVPQCSPNEVFVEYSSIVHHSIRFTGRVLKVNNESLSPEKYCVDGLVNIDRTVANESKGEEHIIVRSCRPRSICNQITCIQRCCKTDQIVEKRTQTNRCQPHPNNTNLLPFFYDIRLPLSDTQRKVQIGKYILLSTV